MQLKGGFSVVWKHQTDQGAGAHDKQEQSGVVGYMGRQKDTG